LFPFSSCANEINTASNFTISIHSLNIGEIFNIEMRKNPADAVAFATLYLIILEENCIIKIIKLCFL
jgi:hypothetical protein